METTDVLVVRIYITEASKLLEQLLDYLKNEAGINGVSVFRAIHGFGTSKTEHSTALVDLSLDLPLAVEFFDEAVKVRHVLEQLNATFKLEHIVFWHAKAVISS
jgi:PII-like signaling protein